MLLLKLPASSTEEKASSSDSLCKQAVARQL
jgi:hypothetical protein